MADRLLTVKQVADKCAMGVRTVWQKVNSGEFPRPVKPAPRITRWRESDVEEWIAGLAEAKR